MKKFSIIAVLIGILCSGALQPSAAQAKDIADEIKGVELMNVYIDFLAHWIEVIDNPSNAIGIAQNSLKDLYMANGETERLEQVLNQALEVVHDRAARNSIRFSLAEIYQGQGKAKLASDQFIKIIEENSQGHAVTSKKSVFE